MDVVDFRHMALVDLRPARNSRPHDVAITVKRNIAGIPGRQDFGFGTRADPAHLAPQYVPHLRQFVDPQPPQESAKPGNADIVLVGHRCAALVLDLARDPHRPELGDPELATLAPGSPLAKQHRPAVHQSDRHRRKRKQWNEQRQHRDREEEVTKVLDRRIGPRRDQATEAVFGQMAHLHPSRERFEQLLDLVDHPSIERGIGQERFPFIGQISKIGDNRIALADPVQVGCAKRVPVNRFHFAQLPGLADRDDRDLGPDSPRDEEIDGKGPHQVDPETQRQRRAMIGYSGKHQQDQYRAMSNEHRRQDDLPGTDARIGTDRNTDPQRDADRKDVGDQRIVEHGGVETRVGDPPATAGPRDQRRKQ